ncbi:putative amino acid protein [Eutypa lata UCREL1]|uniref:Putative amino acid protein n=1 Tax=Eutypa lata (strain UCR-EL1) TaxID=1287681 RepID=M7SNY0_EUTLA|nr:putative amino acid protein [Eutypa lata UCREL1]
MDAEPSAENFFANYVSVILIVILWLGARIFYRGRWYVDLDTVDLDDGRRFYKDDIEKAPVKGFFGHVKKGVGYVFN